MNIVLVGDSHSDFGGLGSGIKSELEGKGHKVTMLAIGGSAASSWLGAKPVCRTIGGKKKCQSLADVAGQKFDLAIIALGTNDAANANRASKEGGGNREKLMQKAVDQIAEIGAKLAPSMVWVGPPKMLDKLPWYTNDAMDALYAVGLPKFGSRVIDSRPMMPAKIGGDGVHPSKATYAVWSKAVAAALAGVVGGAPEAPVDPAAGAQAAAAAEAEASKRRWTLIFSLSGAAVIGGLLLWLYVRRRKKAQALIPASLRPDTESAEQQAAELTVPLPEPMPVPAGIGPLIAPEPMPVGGLFKKWRR